MEYRALPSREKQTHSDKKYAFVTSKLLIGFCWEDPCSSKLQSLKIISRFRKEKASDILTL